MTPGGFTGALLVRTQISRCIEKQRLYAEGWSDDELLRESARKTLGHLEAALGSIEEMLAALQVRARQRPKPDVEAAVPRQRRRRVPRSSATPRPKENG